LSESCQAKRYVSTPRDAGTRPRNGTPPHVTSEADGDPNLDRAIIRHIRRVLDGVRGNKLQAARLLGISRSTLYRLLSGDGGGAEDKARE
jgi:transcriptional regulator of acetoin/glycerol metabolism